MRAAVLSVVLVTALAGAASAERRRRMESGFYLRVSIGASFVRDLVAVRPRLDDDQLGEELDGAVAGVGGALELSIGWVLDRGLALCIFVGTDAAPTSNSGFDSDLVDEAVAAVMNTTGLNLVYYPEPSGPWFVNGGAGIGIADSIGSGTPQAPGDVNPQAADGVGVFFGGGWEFRLSSGWSLGAAGRIQVINADDADPSPARHRGIGFAAMVTTSYNYGSRSQRSD